jgi:hypothetical protein
MMKTIRFKQRFTAVFRELHVNNNHVDYNLQIESTSRNGAIQQARKHAKRSGDTFIELI